MKKSVAALALAFCLAVAAGAQSAPAGDLKFQIDALDRSADPCADFYQYACGNWLARNPVPPDRSLWSRYSQMRDLNQQRVRAILEQAAAGPRSGRSPEEQKIGDYYASCMDESGIEAKGRAPLQPELARIAAIRTPAQLAREVAHLHTLGVDATFYLGSIQDFRQASQVIAFVDQGGLGLPDADYYLKDDADSAQVRDRYLAYLTENFSLLGERPVAASAAAHAVLRLETALAQASLPSTQQHNPEALYHKMTVAEMEALAPHFPWKSYLAEVQAPALTAIDVRVPGFLRGLDPLLDSVPLAVWKDYLRSRLLAAAAPLLPARFRRADFEFYGKVIDGLASPPPRAERCQGLVDHDLGEVVGRLYVRAYFTPETRKKVLHLVSLLRRALREDVQTMPWMSAATRAAALAKLDALTAKIGHPERWRDYSSVRIARGDAMGNARRAAVFEFHRQLAKIGKPVDRGEWFELPQSIEGYSTGELNEIVFTAGILQPPFFDPRMDDAVNFGICGGVIGHELTHNFDNNGRKFDAQGNLRDWWTAEDAAQYQQRAQCFVDQYSQYTAVDDLKVNGRLTLGENIADNGGLHLAYMALMEDLAGKEPVEIDGFTPQQRFFLAWGQIRCTNITPQRARVLARTDSHSPGRWRVNGVVSNMPEFAQAFHCSATAPMVHKDACRIW